MTQEYNLIIVCHKAYCQETKLIEYTGQFIDKWFCPKHRGEHDRH